MNFPVIIVFIHSYYIFHLRLDKDPATNYFVLRFKSQLFLLIIQALSLFIKDVAGYRMSQLTT